MQTETDIRQKKLLDLLKNSAQPLKTDTPDPNLNQPQMRRITVGEGGISGLPEPSARVGVGDSIIPPMPNMGADARVRIGQSTQGMSPSGSQQTYIDLLKQASPRSSVTKTPDFVEEGAPKPKGHGLLNTLGNIGKGIVISTGEYARTHPGASTGELLGAGGAGGVVGGVKPETIDYVRRQAEIGRAEHELGQQLGTEEKQAQIGAKQAEPVLRAQQIANEAETRKGQQDIQRQLEQGRIDRAEAQRQMDALRSAETERHNKEMERQGQAKIDKPLTTKPSEDFGQSAEWNYKKQHEAEAAEKDLRAKADAIKIVTVDDEEKKKNLMSRADESAKNALRYRDAGDKAASKVQNAGPTIQRPETRKGTISKEQQQKWLNDNQGKTLDDMKKLYPNAVIVN